MQHQLRLWSALSRAFSSRSSMMGHLCENALLRTGVPPLRASTFALPVAAAYSDLAPAARIPMPARPAEVAFTNERRVRDGFMIGHLHCELGSISSVAPAVRIVKRLRLRCSSRLYPCRTPALGGDSCNLTAEGGCATCRT